MLATTGIPDKEQIAAVLPCEARKKEGSVAIIECYQEIPCNPCADACPRGAITVAPIHERPQLDEEKCNGCGICLTHCPGLAIVVTDYQYKETEALLKLPYEFSPLPREGEILSGCNREGEPIVDVKVLRVQRSANKTHVLWLAVAKEQVDEVRFVRRKEAKA